MLSYYYGAPNTPPDQFAGGQREKTIKCSCGPRSVDRFTQLRRVLCCVRRFFPFFAENMSGEHYEAAAGESAAAAQRHADAPRTTATARTIARDDALAVAASGGPSLPPDDTRGANRAGPDMAVGIERPTAPAAPVVVAATTTVDAAQGDPGALPARTVPTATINVPSPPPPRRVNRMSPLLAAVATLVGISAVSWIPFAVSNDPRLDASHWSFVIVAFNAPASTSSTIRRLQWHPTNCQSELALWPFPAMPGSVATVQARGFQTAALRIPPVKGAPTSYAVRCAIDGQDAVCPPLEIYLRGLESQRRGMRMQVSSLTDGTQARITSLSRNCDDDDDECVQNTENTITRSWKELTSDIDARDRRTGYPLTRVERLVATNLTGGGGLYSSIAMNATLTATSSPAAPPAAVASAAQAACGGIATTVFKYRLALAYSVPEVATTSGSVVGSIQRTTAPYAVIGLSDDMWYTPTDLSFDRFVSDIELVVRLQPRRTFGLFLFPLALVLASAIMLHAAFVLRESIAAQRRTAVTHHERFYHDMWLFIAVRLERIVPPRPGGHHVAPRKVLGSAISPRSMKAISEFTGAASVADGSLVSTDGASAGAATGRGAEWWTALRSRWLRRTWRRQLPHDHGHADGEPLAPVAAHRAASTDDLPHDAAVPSGGDGTSAVIVVPPLPAAATIPTDAAGDAAALVGQSTHPSSVAHRREAAGEASESTTSTQLGHSASSSSSSSCPVVCRICFDQDPVADLFAPCLCKGTSKYVHRACLAQWLEGTSNDTFRHCCSECKGPFRFEGDPATNPSVTGEVQCRKVTRFFRAAFIIVVSVFAAYFVPLVWWRLIQGAVLWDWSGIDWSIESLINPGYSVTLAGFTGLNVLVTYSSLPRMFATRPPWMIHLLCVTHMALAPLLYGAASAFVVFHAAQHLPWTPEPWLILGNVTYFTAVSVFGPDIVAVAARQAFQEDEADAEMAGHPTAV